MCICSIYLSLAFSLASFCLIIGEYCEELACLWDFDGFCWFPAESFVYQCSIYISVAFSVVFVRLQENTLKNLLI